MYILLVNWAYKGVVKARVPFYIETHHILLMKFNFNGTISHKSDIWSNSGFFNEWLCIDSHFNIIRRSLPLQYSRLWFQQKLSINKTKIVEKWNFWLTDSIYLLTIYDNENSDERQTNVRNICENSMKKGKIVVVFVQEIVNWKFLYDNEY